MTTTGQDTAHLFGQPRLRTACRQSAAYGNAERDPGGTRLGTRSSAATGVEDPSLTAYREGSSHHPLIVAGHVGW